MATLNHEEVDALMNAIREGEVPATASSPARGSVVNYDLTSQDRIIRGQMPTLDAINERAASVFGAGLAGRTRLDVRVTSAPTAMTKFADVTSLWGPPASIAVLSMGPGHGLALIILEAGVADTLLAAALGDKKARAEARTSPGRRELTTVERLVLKRLLTMLCEGLAGAWAPVIAFQPAVLRFESDPRLCNIIPPNDMAILTTFEISGIFSGKLHLIVPYAVVEPARKLLAAPPRAGDGGKDCFQSMLTDELFQVPVELCAILGVAHIRLEELLALKTGDVLTLNTSEGEPVPMTVQGRLKLKGRPQVSNGSLAIQVEQRIDAGIDSPTNAAA